MANDINKRRHKRIKMVLPVRLWARDTFDKPVQELAHTLDITPHGARLGAIRHQLKTGDKVLLQYHQRKIHFRVVWVMPLEGTKEFQVGLEAISNGNETWGLELTERIEENESQPEVLA